MKPPSAPLRVLEWVALHLPLRVTLSLTSHLRRPYAGLARATSYRLPPRDLVHYADQVRDLLGADALPVDASRTIEDRLVYVLSHWLIASRVEEASAEAGRPLLSRIEVRGGEHLSAALAHGRGVVALTAHFGFPHLIGTVLGRLGIAAVAGTSWQRHAGHILSTGDLWTRARSVLQMQAALAERRVCVMLTDGPAARSVRLPFFREHVDIAAGPFHLAWRAGAPILPFFIIAPEGPLHFRLDFGPAFPVGPGRGQEALAEAAAREFVGLYGAYAERYPSHLQFTFIGAP